MLSNADFFRIYISKESTAMLPTHALTLAIAEALAVDVFAQRLAAAQSFTPNRAPVPPSVRSVPPADLVTVPAFSDIITSYRCSICSWRVACEECGYCRLNRSHGIVTDDTPR
jgi:hypothetical protein